MNTLQRALFPNGILAFTSGLVIVIMQKQLAEILGISNPYPLMIIGALVSLFGISVLLEVKMQRGLATLWIIVQDVLWIVGTLYLLIFQPFELSDAAYWIIGLYALPVLVLIWFQGYGLSIMDNKKGSTRKRLRFKRTIRASKERVWKIISDISNYHDVAPNIDDTAIISGEGMGMVRMCSHGKDSWSETCTLWDEGNEYSFTVNTDAPDYPYPLTFLKGNWKAMSLNDQETEIEMVFEFEYKRSFQNLLMHPWMKLTFARVCKELLDNWQQKIEGTTELNTVYQK